MTVIVARLLISLALLASPFALLILANAGRKQANGLMWLIIPFFGGIPAILGALLVFAPLENLLDARGLGHLKDVAIPLAGALLIVIFMVVILGTPRKLAKMAARIRQGGFKVIRPMLFWSVLGAVWGALWRLSAWIAMRVGLASGA